MATFLLVHGTFAKSAHWPALQKGLAEAARATGETVASGASPFVRQKSRTADIAKYGPRLATRTMRSRKPPVGRLPAPWSPSRRGQRAASPTAPISAAAGRGHNRPPLATTHRVNGRRVMTNRFDCARSPRPAAQGVRALRIVVPIRRGIGCVSLDGAVAVACVDFVLRSRTLLAMRRAHCGTGR